MAHALVVGAGIGGLAAAVALRRDGWTVTVCERAPAIGAVGAGLAVAPNALKALDTIGLGDDVRRLSAMQGEAGMRRIDGRWIYRTSAEAAAARYGDETVVLLRSTLVDLLMSRLAPDDLRPGTTVTEVDPETGKVTTAATGVIRETNRVTTSVSRVDAEADGRTTNEGEFYADLVVAADGIHSPIRQALFPDHPGPVYSGTTSWRMIVPRPDGPCPLSETWGSGQVFGITALTDDQMYCYATATVPPGGTAGDEQAELLRLFGTWHDAIPRLIASAHPDKVLRNDIFCLDTPLPAFHKGKVALLGDAAHAMTPNLGQGACQAIEDAVVLAHVASGSGDLGAYSSARVTRTMKIVKRSRTIGRLTQWTNPLAVGARNAAMSASALLGPGLALRQFDDVFAWRPPA